MPLLPCTLGTRAWCAPVWVTSCQKACCSCWKAGVVVFRWLLAFAFPWLSFASLGVEMSKTAPASVCILCGAMVAACWGQLPRAVRVRVLGQVLGVDARVAVVRCDAQGLDAHLRRLYRHKRPPVEAAAVTNPSCHSRFKPSLVPFTRLVKFGQVALGVSFHLVPLSRCPHQASLSVSLCVRPFTRVAPICAKGVCLAKPATRSPVHPRSPIVQSRGPSSHFYSCRH